MRLGPGRWDRRAGRSRSMSAVRKVSTAITERIVIKQA
jgi:hypothetical protein